MIKYKIVIFPTMKHFLYALIPFVCAVALAEPFVLVEDGRPVSAIVISRWSDRTTATGAMQLRDYVLQMTGAELPILTAAYDKGFLANWKPGNLLPSVGDLKDLKPIFLGCAFSTEGEYRLTVAPTHIRIDGCESAGVLYGVDALLERLGVFWPHPDRLWREIPQSQTLTVEECDEHSKPFFRIRAVHHHQSDTALFAWMGLNRLNYRLQNPPGWYDTGMQGKYGVEPFFISHSWHFWIPPQALKEHPEWNPLVKGERLKPDFDHNPSLIHHQLCISNPEVRKCFIDNILQYLKKNPQMRMIPLETNDGNGWCECDACKAYGATISEQFFRFVGEAAEAIRQFDPAVTVLCLSYGAHKELPSFPLPDNLCFGIVYNSRNYARPLTDESNRPFYEQLTKWAKAYPGRVYIYELWAKTHFVGWPHPYAKVFAEDIKLYRDLKLAGLCPEGIHPSPLQEYLRGKLAWNPDLDWKELLKEFCTKTFGSASAPMEQYYLLLEERMVEHGQNLLDLTSISDYIAPIDRQANELLEQAAKLADNPRIAKRIAFERSQLDKLHGVLEQWMPCTRDVVTDQMRAENILPNGDFEKGMNDIGHDTRWGKYRFNVIDGEAYHGKKCGEITVVEHGWARMVMNAPKGLDTNKKYALYCAVKTLDGADGAHFWFIPGGCNAQLYTLGPTNGQWYRAVFHNIEIRADGMQVLLTVHGLPSTGRILWDDVLLLPEK